MAYYLFQASYPREQVQAMVKNPQDRSVAARTLIEGLGGKLHHMFLSFGDCDIVAIIEMPDNASMAAGSMTVAAMGGAGSVKTTPLLTMAEAQEAMKKAGTQTGYKPPSG